MKELIPMNRYGMFADRNDTARVSSLMVAELFGKDHRKVVRDVESLDCSPEFNAANFGRISYEDSRGRKQKAYAMTRDGFMFLAMGYRGKKAAQIKEAYIREFNKMEAFIRTLVEARNQFPLLTSNIKLIHEKPKPHHFSNEADMLNRMVLGMTAKQFREARGIKAGESIRPYLTSEQIATLNRLQMIDAGLLLAMPDFGQRKRQLQWYLSQTQTTSAEEACDLPRIQESI